MSGIKNLTIVQMRHQDLKTAQGYLGKTNDTEAIRWVDILHGK
jgi:hypothetical protein